MENVKIPTTIALLLWAGTGVLVITYTIRAWKATAE